MFWIFYAVLDAAEKLNLKVKSTVLRKWWDQNTLIVFYPSRRTAGMN